MNTIIFTDDGAETAVRETPAEVGLTINVAIRIEDATILLTRARGGQAGFVVARIVRWERAGS